MCAFHFLLNKTLSLLFWTERRVFSFPLSKKNPRAKEMAVGFIAIFWPWTEIGVVLSPQKALPYPRSVCCLHWRSYHTCSCPLLAPTSALSSVMCPIPHLWDCGSLRASQSPAQGSTYIRPPGGFAKCTNERTSTCAVFQCTLSLSWWHKCSHPHFRFTCFCSAFVTFPKLQPWSAVSAQWHQLWVITVLRADFWKSVAITTLPPAPYPFHCF